MVTTCIEILETPGNLTAGRELVTSQRTVRKNLVKENCILLTPHLLYASV